MTVYDPSTTPIAVVGVSAVFPGSVDKTGFWRDIVAGTDLIGDIPESHWLIDDYYDPDPKAPDKTYAHRGAFLSDMTFDPLEWGVPPSIVPATDTTQLLALIVAKQVLQDASRNGDLGSIDRDRMACILGVTSAQELLGTMVNRLQRPVWVKSLRELGYAEDEVTQICDQISGQYVPWQESTFPGLLGNVVAGRIANRLDLGGTNCVTDAACASSFSAMSMAMNELWLDQADIAITGGCDTMNDIFMYMCFSKTPALSQSGECRPFSDKADGTLLGEGLGMVALKRLGDAERDGDRIYAVVRGLGSSSDGRSKSVYAPVPEGQAKALRRAYSRAGYGPESVELVEAHGTGTKAGDAAEFAGLSQAFDEVARDDRQWCALGTVKSQIGHTKAAAGAAGLFKVVMALQHKVLPPTLKIDRPNPKLDIENSPFYLNTESRPWVRSSDHPRRASVSSFGFGGSNFHLALEEYTGPAPKAWRLRTSPTEVVVLGAASASELVAAARTMADRSDIDGFLQFAARSSQEAYDPGQPARLGVVARDEADLATKLRQIADRIERDSSQSLSIPTGLHYATGRSPGMVGFLFPGQGSQYLGMGADLAMAYDAAVGPWDRAADLPLGDTPLHDIVFPAAGFEPVVAKTQVAALRATECAQPAIGVVSLSQLALLGSLGLAPDMVGGHSYGEITALHAAGVLGADDVLRIARRRGELMACAAADTEGSMTAVPRSLDEVRPFADAVDGAVLANHNAPNQVVVSGPTPAIESIEADLEAAGIEPKRLKVATAFHSPVVEASVAPFTDFLATVDFSAPGLPAYHNADAAPHPSDPAQIRARLGAAIARPVRFVEQVEAMWQAGVRTFVEVGPGNVLTNLVGEILGEREHVAVNLDRRKKHGLTTLNNAIARLCVAGVPLTLGALWQSHAPAADPHDATQPRLSLTINGSNYDKPYPPPGGSAALPGPNPVRVGPAAARDPQPQIVEKVVERVVEVPVPTPGATSPGPLGPTGSSVSSVPSVSSVSSTALPSTASPPRGAPAMSTPTDPSWLTAFQETQRATLDAHSVYQKAMADTHLAFLQTVEQSMAGLMSLATGAPAPTHHPAAQRAAPAVTASPPASPWSPAPAAPPVRSEPWTPPTTAVGDVAIPVQSGTELFASQSVAPAPAAVASPAAVPQPAAVDLEALLLEVVADKTGYPAEMLGLHMGLESDLGVDSIKRVEILSAMREQARDLPEVDAGELAQLQTLGQIVDHMRASMGPVAAAPASPASAIDLEALLLEVVADKTGYPAEMLGLHMGLESDLGVDSIKRVEILSAMREQAPDLPEVDAGELAQLQTLGQIVDHMRASMGPVAAAPASPASAIDLEALLLEVVADKTGYPAEMLGLHMGLESDLGVDSIKRVEILSAMREQAPDLPEVDASELAQLQTLGQIVDHMRASIGAVATPPAVPNGSPAIDLESLLLDVVADKTGYPADMLGMHMALESDLGVDSIKRVEILSAMRERAPDLPEVDAGELAQLQTLGQIVDHMRASIGPAAPAAASAAPAIDLESLLLAVVADKTGYPADMLGMHMALESDLGVDSIKRVEILSAMRERAPDLPEVDAGELAQLQTLGQIVDHMRASMGGSASMDATPQASAAADVVHAVATPELGRWSLAAVDTAPTGLSLPGLHARAQVAVVGGDAFGPAVVAALEAEGISATLGDPSDAHEVVLALHGLQSAHDPVSAGAVHRAVFQLAKAVAPQFAGRGGLFVTVQDTGGDFGLSGSDRAWLGGLPGLVKTLVQEWPAAVGKSIDIAVGDREPADVGRALVEELLFGGSELEVGLTETGRRLTLASEPQAADPTAPAIERDTVIVASGGARGVTARTLVALARANGGRYVLLGRTPLTDESETTLGIEGDAALKGALLGAAKASGEALPTPVELGRAVSKVLGQREIRTTLADLGAAGCEARYLAVDVTEPRALTEALADVRSTWGPIGAVIHGAGVLADRLIADKSVEQFDRVFDTKVGGLYALLTATADDPLRAIGLFSSVAGRCGNRGQVDYAMANEVLNKVAQLEARRRPDCLVKAFDWGPWDAGMVDAALKAHFESLGVPLISLDAGAKMLVDELADRSGAVELVLGGEPRMGPLAAASSDRAVRLRVRADRRSLPFLSDHAIDGVPVVPVVLAVEWFARASHAVRPDLMLTHLRDVRVRRGMKLGGFDAGGDWFDVTAREVSNGLGAVVELELRSVDGDLNYSATAQLDTAIRQAATGADATSPVALAGLEPPDSTEIYDGHVLFHGSEFQVIRSVDGIGDAGVRATLTSTRDAGWGDGWRTDPAAWDGGLQLALLWSKRVLGGATLPMGIGAVHSYRDGPPEGPVQATLSGTVHGRDRAVTDIVFTDRSGEVVAELRGVEVILRPGEPTRPAPRA